MILLYTTWKESKKNIFAFIFDPEGLVPNLTDLKEMFGTFKWFFGGKRPYCGRWIYWEKFDFMAVFWGIAVIGSSGLALWFPVQFSQYFPGYWLNIATIIHSDEALLAAGFIFTIHFYNTHLRPEKFPLDPVIFVGSITLDELKHERPREYDQLVASGELDKLVTRLAGADGHGLRPLRGRDRLRPGGVDHPHHGPIHPASVMAAQKGSIRRVPDLFALRSTLATA